MFLRRLRAVLASLALGMQAKQHSYIFAEPMAAAFDSAMADEGMGEDPLGSNSGEYVEGLREEVNLPRLAGGEWCAVFCSVHLQRVGINLKSRGARKLVTAMERKGRKVTYKDLKPGLCGLSLHKRSGGWHVRMWRCDEDKNGLFITCVGGNERHRVAVSRYSAKAYAATAKTMATI